MPNTRRIALVVPAGWEYAHLLTEGILQFQGERGNYLLRDFLVDDPAFEPPPHPPDWEQWQPCGVLCAIGNELGLADWLLSGRLPLVNMTADVPAELMPSVYATGGSIMAVEHLVSLGIRDIAHIGLNGVFGSQLRYQNISKSAREWGVELLSYDMQTDPVGSLSGRMREAVAEPGLLEFLRAAPKPLGVVALNDDFAVCVSIACQSCNLRIPHDVAIVGTDDTLAARFCQPPITTVRPPGRQVGYQAMKLLVDLLAGGNVPTESLTIPCTEIVVRQSTQFSPDDLMDRAKTFIENEACRGLGVGDLVKELGISRSNLEKRFNKRFGTAPGEVFKQVRLERAKYLLKETELSITRISAMLGYSRDSVFTTFFRKCESTTPSEYRNRAKQVQN